MNKKTCKAKDCDGRPISRELCSAHYQQFARAVAEGKTTWKKLERENRCGPSRKRHTNAFAI